MSDLVSLQKILGYQFKDESLLTCALTHRSIQQNNNERLEFLGDSILNFVMAEALFRRYADLQEGELSRVRAGLVNGEMLATLARKLKLGPYLTLGMGEVKSGGHERDSILADAVEAIIGAIYLDGGMSVARQFIIDLFGEACLDELKQIKLQKDPKSALQEWLQSQQLPLPTYTATTSGKAHEQTFYVVCTVAGLSHKTEGTSSNRRKAEQVAAEAYLKIIHCEDKK